MRRRELVALATAVASDTLVEVLGGFVPVAGDVLDVVQLAVLLWAFGLNPLSFVSLGELLPLADLFPFHTVVAALSLLRKKKRILSTGVAAVVLAGFLTWFLSIGGGSSVEIDFDVGEATPETLRNIHVVLRATGYNFVYPFCVANDSQDNVFVTVVDQTRNQEVVEDYFVPPQTRALWQFESGTVLQVTVRAGWGSETYTVSVPVSEDEVEWIVVTDYLFRRETRPITDRGELISPYSLELDFGTMGVPPRVYQTGFEEMNTADDLRNDGWIVMDSNVNSYLEELSFPTTDKGKSLYFRTYGWWNYPLVLTPEWTGEVEYEFCWKPDNRYSGTIAPRWLIMGIDGNGNEIWCGFGLWGNSYGSWSRYYDVVRGYWVYCGGGRMSPELTEDYLLNWHTIKIRWTKDNILSWNMDNKFYLAMTTAVVYYHYPTGTWTSIPQSPIGSRYRLALFDRPYAWESMRRGAYYDFAIRELGVPPARPIVVLPCVENFHLTHENWSVTYNLVLKTDPEGCDNVHTFYISPEQAKALLERHKLKITNHSKYPVDVEVNLKVTYAATEKVTKKKVSLQEK